MLSTKQLNTKKLDEEKIIICSDSQAAIKALENCSKGHIGESIVMNIIKLAVEYNNKEHEMDLAFNWQRLKQARVYVKTRRS